MLACVERAHKHCFTHPQVQETACPGPNPTHTQVLEMNADLVHAAGAGLAQHNAGPAIGVRVEAGEGRCGVLALGVYRAQAHAVVALQYRLGALNRAPAHANHG
jgi:hypothetical protein